MSNEFVGNEKIYLQLLELYKKTYSTLEKQNEYRGQKHGSQLCCWPTAQVDPISVWHMRR